MKTYELYLVVDFYRVMMNISMYSVCRSYSALTWNISCFLWQMYDIGVLWHTYVCMPIYKKQYLIISTGATCMRDTCYRFYLG